MKREEFVIAYIRNNEKSISCISCRIKGTKPLIGSCAGFCCRFHQMLYYNNTTDIIITTQHECFHKDCTMSKENCHLKYKYDLRCPK